MEEFEIKDNVEEMEGINAYLAYDWDENVKKVKGVEIVSFQYVLDCIINKEMLVRKKKKKKNHKFINFPLFCRSKMIMF